MTEQMRDAIKGQGGGLQSISTTVGEMMAGGADTRGSQQKKADDASTSLGNMANPNRGGQTTEGTVIGADKQTENMAGGSADHLGLGMRK